MYHVKAVSYNTANSSLNLWIPWEWSS